MAGQSNSGGAQRVSRGFILALATCFLVVGCSREPSTSAKEKPTSTLRHCINDVSCIETANADLPLENVCLLSDALEVVSGGCPDVAFGATCEKSGAASDITVKYRYEAATWQYLQKMFRRECEQARGGTWAPLK